MKIKDLRTLKEDEYSNDAMWAQNGLDNPDQEFDKSTYNQDDFKDDLLAQDPKNNPKPSVDSSIKQLRDYFNQSKTIEFKDACVGTALEKFGVDEKVVDKLGEHRTLLSDFVRAFKWEEFKNDNDFIKYLKNFPSSKIDNSLVLKYPKYFELVYNNYVHGNLDDSKQNVINGNVYKNEYWMNIFKNTTSNNVTKTNLSNNIARGMKNNKQNTIDAIADGISKEDTKAVISKLQAKN